MSKFISTIEKIFGSSDRDENMEETVEVLDKVFYRIEKINPELYREAMYELEEIAYKITLPEAQEKVKKMKPYGEMWDYEKIKEVLHSKGIKEDCIEYYLVMNMMYNDYCDTAKMMGKENDVDFYFSLSKDFINDVDATPFKVAKYFSL